MNPKKHAPCTPDSAGYVADAAPCFADVKHVHCFPLYGRAHQMSLECWCHPDFNPRQQPTVIVHHVEH